MIENRESKIDNDGSQERFGATVDRKAVDHLWSVDCGPWTDTYQ